MLIMRVLAALAAMLIQLAIGRQREYDAGSARIGGRAMPQIRVAYFSMEIGLDSAVPTYAGGLGVQAGDMLRAAADLGVPVAGVTLLHRQGYFRQRLDPEGNQTELPATWRPEDRLEPLEPRPVVMIEGRPVLIRAWRHVLRGGPEAYKVERQQPSLRTRGVWCGPQGRTAGDDDGTRSATQEAICCEVPLCSARRVAAGRGNGRPASSLPAGASRPCPTGPAR